MKSRSIARWPAAPPADARVVPRAEKKIEGGEVVGNDVGQVVVSAEMMGWKVEVPEALGRARREKA